MRPSPLATRVCARTAAGILIVVAAFQLAVALGAPWGALTQGGATDGVLPPAGRAVAAVSMAILLLMAGAMLARVGEGSMRVLPQRVVTVLAWFTTVYSGLAVILNLATPSARERALWAPVSVVLLVLIAVTMIGSRRDRTSGGTDERAP